MSLRNKTHRCCIRQCSMKRKSIQERHERGNKQHLHRLRHKHKSTTCRTEAPESRTAHPTPSRSRTDQWRRPTGSNRHLYKMVFHEKDSNRQRRDSRRPVRGRTIQHSEHMNCPMQCCNRKDPRGRRLCNTANRCSTACCLSENNCLEAHPLRIQDKDPLPSQRMIRPTQQCNKAEALGRLGCSKLPMNSTATHVRSSTTPYPIHRTARTLGSQAIHNSHPMPLRNNEKVGHKQIHSTLDHWRMDRGLCSSVPLSASRNTAMPRSEDWRSREYQSPS